MIVGYARVSTDGQALDAQQTALQSRRGRLVDQSAKPPSAKARKPVSALPPQMGIVLTWPLFSSVARASTPAISPRMAMMTCRCRSSKKLVVGHRGDRLKVYC